MALNVIRGRSKRAAPVVPAPLPIGEIEGDIFNCPTCARPLAPGARRCQGCGTRLVLGVPAVKASLFVAFGLALGLLVAGSVALASAMLARPTSAGAPPPLVTGSPSPSTSPRTPRPTHAATGIPAMARSALGQAAALHVRLAAARDDLEPLMRPSRVNASAVADVLRAIAADAANGVNLPPRIEGWDEASPLAAELAAFYEEVRETARDALRYSVANRSAYRAAGQAMVALLDELPALDERTRALAAAGGADLPPPYEP